VRTNADEQNISRQRIGVMGFGAGGHLAGCAGVRIKRGESESEDPVARWNSRPDAMVLLYPVVNLREKCPDEIRMNLLGSGFEDVEDTETALDDLLSDFGLDGDTTPPEEKPEKKRERRHYVSDYEGDLSLHMQVSGNTPPTFMVHTVNNRYIPCEHSLFLARSLRDAGIPSEIHLYEEGPKEFGLANRHPHLSTWTGLCARWLQLRGFIGRMGG
jgi:acetyl esterase/lipase